MKTKCPHCKKDIELLGTKELAEVYGLSANQVQYARENGQLPEPFITLENRYLYERTAMEEFIERRSLERIERAVSELVAGLDNLPEEEKAAARKMLDTQLGGRKRA